MLGTLQPMAMEDVKLTIDSEELEKIPIMNYKDLESNIKTANAKCTICQDSFNNDDKLRNLGCNHAFHTDCIDEWLTKHSYKCPCCRTAAAKYKSNI
jgi:hypothetical protein